jgi:hypothetical protein
MMYTANPVTAKTRVTKVNVSEDGQFSFEIPMSAALQ